MPILYGIIFGSIGQHAPFSLFILSESRKTLHPIAGVKIMDVSIPAIRSLMDVAADDSVHLLGNSKLGQFLFEA